MAQQNLSPESIQLIANLINDKNKDLKDHLEEQHNNLVKHVSDQKRMVKLTLNPV